MRFRFDLMKDARHAMRAVPLGSTDEMVQCLALFDGELVLEKGSPLIHFCGHKMNSHANDPFSMKHLPERRHHALISGKRGVMNVNAAPWRQGKERLSQNVRAGDGDNDVGRAFTNGLHELDGVWVANLQERDAVRTCQLLKTVELLRPSAFPDFA